MEVIKKSLENRDNLKLVRAFTLLQDAGFILPTLTSGELKALHDFSLDKSAEQIAGAIVEMSGWRGTGGVGQFTNRLSPGQPEPIISTPGYSRPRERGWTDQNLPARSAGGQATVSGDKDQKTPDDMSGLFGGTAGYRNPKKLGPGYVEDDEKTGTDTEEYYGPRSAGGSGEDVMPTRTTTKPTRYTGLGQRGGQQPAHPPRGPGRSGHYGRGSSLETIKSFEEKLEKFRRWNGSPDTPMPQLGKVEEIGNVSLIKGISRIFKAKREEDEEREDMAYPTGLTRAEDEQIKRDGVLYEEAEKTDEEARKIESLVGSLPKSDEEEDELETAKKLRLKAMQIRAMMKTNESTLKLLRTR